MPVRETFWNIPQWAKLFMYTANFVGIAILIAKLYLRSRLWLKGQGELPFDRLPERAGRVIKYALLQMRIAREKYARIFHLSIFYAFVLLFIGTTLVALDEYVPLVFEDFHLLKGTFYLVYEATLDFFTVVGIVGISLAMLRRAFSRPEKLTYSAGFGAMLWIILLDLLTGLAVESFRLAAVRPGWEAFSFAGYLVSRTLLTFNPTMDFLRTGHLVFWVAHAGLTGLFFAVFMELPLKHIIYSPLNIFFSSFKERGTLAALDLEDEEADSFGVGQLHELSVMQLMDGDACTECGRCQVACPAYMAGTALNPKQVILDIRMGMDRYGPDLLRLAEDQHKPEMPVVREIVGQDALWACTTCRACVDACPVLIEHVDSIVDMRRHLTLMEGDLPDLLAGAMTQAERAGDPWGNPRGSRMDWAEGLDVPVMAEKMQADVLYWIGCAGSYDPESQKTARAMVKIFEAAGIDYAVLGNEERCNTEWARRGGNEYLFQESTHSNIAVFDKYAFNTIVTHCPHCFNTFKNEYPQFGGDYDVVHHSTYISGLIKAGYLKVPGAVRLQMTYHDSCYLGRYNDVYDDPREALKSISGLRLTEMPRSRENGLCCGGGGAQVWMETHQENPVNEIRLAEAMETGADTVGTACPFCTIMLTSAAQSRGVTDQVAVKDRVTVKDIAVIVAEALE